jgi:hypothetical protein
MQLRQFTSQQSFFDETQRNFSLRESPQSRLEKVLRLEFDDIEHKEAPLILLTPEHARQIREFEALCQQAGVDVLLSTAAPALAVLPPLPAGLPKPIREVLYTGINTYTDSESDVWVVKLDDGTIAGVTINNGVFCDRPIGNLMELLQQNK